MTGIVITSPGTYAGGETPTITLSGGGGTILPFTTTALATLNGAGGLTKTGAGSLTVAGTNTFTGTTTVENGTLLTTVFAPAGSASSVGAGSGPIVLGGTSTSGTLSNSGAHRRCLAV